MIDVKDSRLEVGAWVIYRAAHMERGEDGTVSSLHGLPAYVHVRFGHAALGQACHPRDLSWPAEAAPVVEAPAPKRARKCRGKGSARAKAAQAAAAAERIEAVAIRVGTGTVLTLPRPARHADVRRELRCSGEDGFLTSTGRFVDRAEAARIAFEAGQIRPKPRSAPFELQSPDVW